MKALLKKIKLIDHFTTEFEIQKYELEREFYYLTKKKTNYEYNEQL